MGRSTSAEAAIRLGRLLRELREKRYFEPDDVHSIDATRLIQFERGTKDASLPTLAGLAREYGVPLHRLVNAYAGEIEASFPACADVEIVWRPGAATPLAGALGPLTQGERFGRLLRRLRQARGISVRGVEQHTRQGSVGPLTKSTLARLESGETIPTLSMIAALGELYRMSPAFLAEWYDRAAEETAGSATPGDPGDGEVFDVLLGLLRRGDYPAILNAVDSVLLADGRHGPRLPSVLRRRFRILELVCLNKLRYDYLVRYRSTRLLDQRIDPPLSQEDRLRVTLLRANSRFNLRSFEAALTDLEFVRDRWDPSRFSSTLGCCYSIQGAVLSAVGKQREAVEAHRNAYFVYKSANNVYETCRSAIAVSSALIVTGDCTSTAQQWLAPSLQEARDKQYMRIHALGLGNAATLAYTTGRRDAAMKLYEKSSAEAERLRFFELLDQNRFYQERLGRGAWFTLYEPHFRL